jgi:hypothetical protein
MIAYYPLEDDVAQAPPPKKTQQKIVFQPPPQVKGFFDGETTECNYLVFAFIIGVLLLALADFMKR